jgi:DNA (cytosine-5)-methyltransferase 1
LKKLTCGGLFSGIGGFCYGFESESFETLWAIDLDKDATDTYRENFKNVEVIQGDIASLNEMKAKLPQVDLLHAGFPCQSFSQAGNRKGFDDPRGALFFEIIKFIANQGSNRPAAILLENSPHLMWGDGGAWFDRVRIELQRSGYWFGPENAPIIDARAHGGLPQRRERLFMVALSREVFDYNPFFGLEENNVVDDLVELLDLDGSVEERYYLPKSNKYGNMIYEAGSKIPQNCLIQLRKSILRPQAPGVCPTLTANMGRGGHNVPFIIDTGRLRKLTERECLRLQGFPETFTFPDIVSSAKYRLIGNEV